ncbi:hypothetical protein BO94DRAFT_540923 [Aspergillus sclerotioniger CBS 115572]|uniref:Uncharacterized protein n=1 Tax=Aspergillus sclerotioniger CBS 115572 TaxID=1450535 RepID=A0A317USF4_9EURO|nr:hypothetical protein BO94DRAFT_540923 [Aspergillus sclerotioniger CBS 115572]PWY64973.1 hypothetical protein BO94DRAFT_540923 [Aspergillus sclerotioniger CBS 115572]
MNSPSPHDEVTVAFTVTLSSPTLSLPLSTPLKVFIRPRIIKSTRPGEPVTLLVNDSALEASEPGQWPKAVALGALGQGLQSKHDPTRVIPFGVLIPHYPEPYYSPTSLYGRGHFVTLPGSGDEVVITHEITRERLFVRSDLRPEDIQSGEEFQLCVSRHGRRIEWWCWGDLEGDLQGKNLHPWVQGEDNINAWHPRPSPEEIERENHVLGGDPDKILVTDESGWVPITIVRDVVGDDTDRVDVTALRSSCPALHPR